MIEDYPTKPKPMSKFRFFASLKNPGASVIVEGTGLKAHAEVVEVLGDTQVVAVFAVNEIIGIWPEEPSVKP